RRGQPGLPERGLPRQAGGQQQHRLLQGLLHRTVPLRAALPCAEVEVRAENRPEGERLMRSESASYKAAGVDITAGYRAVELMKKHVQRTERPGVLGGLGGFGGLFLPNLAGMKEPVLVSGTDGVGTKLKIAFLMDKHDTVGID